MSETAGFKEVTNVLNSLKKVNADCELNKVKVTKNNQVDVHMNWSGRDFFFSDIMTVIGKTRLYKWADDKSGEWTFSLQEPVVEEIRSPESIVLSATSPVNAPTEREWNLVVSKYLQGYFTPEVVDRLNEERRDPFFFKTKILFTIKQIMSERAEQLRIKTIKEAESVALQKKLDSQKGTGVCPSHAAGFVRDNIGKTFKVSFHNPRRAEAYCNQCGSPNAMMIIYNK